MGDGIDSPELEGATPLELALDRATEQYMASMQERRGGRRSAARTSATTAMVVANDEAYLPARLSWRGIEVTEEFQDYAMRVSRGEQLEPFRGQVLARPCPEFPWSAPANEQEHTSTESLPHFRSRGPRMAAWLFGIGAVVMAGLGIGSGTTSPGDELDAFVLPPTTTALALRPASRELEPTSDLDEPDTRIASAIESALAHAVPSEDTERAAARALPSAGLPALATTNRLTPPSASLATSATPSSASVTASLGGSSAPSSTSMSATLATPVAPVQRPALSSNPGTSVSASLTTAATSGGPMSSATPQSSSLFADSPSF